MPPAHVNQENDDIIPKDLRNLPPNFKVEIFNRMTGQVMSGADAIAMKDLPDMLREHAEYEPIVPKRHILESFRTGDNTDPKLSRLKRSSPRTRSSASAQPQSRIRASAAEGRSVVVTAGTYTGKVGKVEACMPGGWYLVSDLLDDDDLSLDVVVHSRNLELVSKECEVESTRDRSSSPSSQPSISAKECSSIILKEAGAKSDVTPLDSD